MVTTFWRNELKRVENDYRKIYGRPASGEDLRELREIAKLEFDLEQMTLRARAAEQSAIDVDRRARKRKPSGAKR